MLPREARAGDSRLDLQRDLGPKRKHILKHPTNHGFWNLESLSSWALEPGCRIFVFHVVFEKLLNTNIHISGGAFAMEADSESCFFERAWACLHSFQGTQASNPVPNIVKRLKQQ